MDNIKSLYRKLPVICVVTSLAAPLAFGEVIYETDFATRTSAVVVPPTEWHACDYVTDLLANTNGAAPFALPPDNKQLIQDGWIKTADSTTDARVWAGKSGNDNPAVVLGLAGTGSNKATCFEKQRIGNTFSNGTVKIQFDFLPPANWGKYDQSDTAGNVQRRTTLSFGDENFFSPSVSQAEVYEHTIGSVGVVLVSQSGRKVYWNANKDEADAAPSDQAVTQGKWLRAAVTIDLDARKWGFSMFDMGVSQPAMDAATPASAICSLSNLDFADDSVTNISSIALGGIGVFWRTGASYSSSSDPTHTAWFDNIRIWHNDEACYENDFATRRWRTFGGTTSHTYVADSLVTNRVEKEVYVVDQNLVLDRENDGTTVQPEGIDRWRRVNKDGTGNAAVKSDGNGTYLRFDLSRDGNKKNFYAFLAQPLESAISSGKLKFSVDTRLPSGNYWKYQSGLASLLWVTLGSASYYAGNPDNFSTYRWAAVGIRAQADGNKVTYVPRSGDSVNSLPDTGSISVGTWYRLVVEADIDNGNYVYKVYEQGTAYPDSATADGTLIYTSPAIVKKDTISTISSFSLAAYYCPVYFDNIKIWHTPTGSATDTLLYENYFTSRTIYAQNTRVAPLVGTLERNPEGQDNWTRVNNTQSGIFVDWADGNPALTFDRTDEYSAIYAVQDLGQTVKNGTLTLQADMRPPKGWLKNNDGAAYVRLGGDVHRQGTLRGGDINFLNNIATGFGFKCTSAGKSDNIYTNSTIAAYCGDLNGGGAMTNAVYDVVSTNWYRFIATVDVSKSQYDVAVYDMGATHPTLDTATPVEPVATFSELPFRRTKADLGGISCVSVSGYKTVQSLYDQSLEPMVDNIRVSRTVPGLVLTIK